MYLQFFVYLTNIICMKFYSYLHDHGGIYFATVNVEHVE